MWNQFFLCGDIGPVVDIEHGRDAGSVNVGIHQAYFMALFGKGGRDINRNRRFSYSAFTGSNSDNIFHAGQNFLLLLLLLARFRSFHLSFFREIDGHLNIYNGFFVNEFLNGFFTFLAKLVFQGFVFFWKFESEGNVFILYD